MDTRVASRILRELELAGYFRKERDEQNRRNLNIFLTDEGRKEAEKSLTIQGDYWCVLIEVFTPDEIAALNMLLLKMEMIREIQNGLSLKLYLIRVLQKFCYKLRTKVMIFPTKLDM